MLQIWVLLHILRKIPEKEVKNTDCFIIPFDKSLNAITQTCQMDIIVPYLDLLTMKVKMRYWI